MIDPTPVSPFFFLKRFVILAIVVLSASSCGTELGKSFGDMFEIRDAIIEMSEAEEVGVKIHNNSSLAINVVNSPLNDASAEERNEFAEKVAAKAFEIYKQRDSLKVVFVAFTEFERKYLVVSYSQTIQGFRYDPAEIRAWLPRLSQSDASKVSAD